MAALMERLTAVRGQQSRVPEPAVSAALVCLHTLARDYSPHATIQHLEQRKTLVEQLLESCDSCRNFSAVAYRGRCYRGTSQAAPSGSSYTRRRGHPRQQQCTPTRGLTKRHTTATSLHRLVSQQPSTTAPTTCTRGSARRRENAAKLSSRRSRVETAREPSSSRAATRRRTPCSRASRRARARTGGRRASPRKASATTARATRSRPSARPSRWLAGPPSWARATSSGSRARGTRTCACRTSRRPAPDPLPWSSTRRSLPWRSGCWTKTSPASCTRRPTVWK